jgi:arsenate reductase (thioredoxin)
MNKAGKGNFAATAPAVTPTARSIRWHSNCSSNAVGEVCPYWPGQPMTAHWGIPDPATVEATDMEKKLAFRQAFNAMETRIKLFPSLPLARTDSLRLKERMDAIGQTPQEVPPK